MKHEMQQCMLGGKFIRSVTRLATNPVSKSGVTSWKVSDSHLSRTPDVYHSQNPVSALTSLKASDSHPVQDPRCPS